MVYRAEGRILSNLAAMDEGAKDESQPQQLPRRRRVLLWDYHIEPSLVAGLSDANIEVVATVDGMVAGLPHFSLSEMQFGSSRLNRRRSPLPVQPSAEMLRIYTRSAGRIGLVPWTRALTVHYGGLLEPTEVEDWARLHMQYSAEVLQSMSVDEVWFFTIPHLGVDSAMQETALHLGLRVLILRQLIFPAKFLFHAWENGKRITPQVDGFSRWTKEASKLDLFYMRPRRWRGIGEATGERFRAFINAVRTGSFRHLLGRIYTGALDRKWWRLVAFLEFSDYATRGAGALHSSMARVWKAHRAKRKIISLVEVGEPFVYFPLHYEPEANSDIYGAAFTNQIDAIEALCLILPKGWQILLKENPKQSFLRRGAAFFKRIELLADVRWVSDDTATDMLLQRSALTATITGTIGWETISCGRACIYFGDPWYASMPGAFKFDPSLDLLEVSRLRFEKSELDVCLQNFLSDAADGLVAARYAGQLPATLSQAEAGVLTAASLVKITRALDLLCDVPSAQVKRT